MATLYFLCGGAPPTRDVHLIVPILNGAGWDAWVIPTPYGERFLDAPAVEAESGHRIRSDYRFPGEDPLPPPDAVLAAPFTFNSVNKWAAGIADTFALGLLTEAIGERRPVALAPWAKPALTSHPAFDRSVELMRSRGVCLILGAETEPLVAAAEVPEFPWRSALAALPAIG